MVLDSRMEKNAIYNVPVPTRILAVTKLCQPNRLGLQTNLSCAFEDGVKHLFPYVLLVWACSKENTDYCNS